MEGSGGMVAVVQGLQDAGLAITLLSQRCDQSGRAVLVELVGQTSPTQSCQISEDTATAETVVANIPKGTQYRSSYQLAYCQPSGLSPVRLPPYSVQGFQQFRSHMSRSSNEEAFVESLRKYPSAPIRSRSADLIERMLSRSQQKNEAKHLNTTNAKSPPSKEVSKYFRLDEIPTKDTTKDLKTDFGYKRNIELSPTSTRNRRSRYDDHIGTYDYLNSKHKDIKGSEVRYLTNVKQCLREKLRSVCDEDPETICGKLRTRYIQHRRQCHTADVSPKSQKGTDKGNMMQASSQNGVRISPSTSKERKESRSKVNRLPPFRNSKACFCDRPRPCDCGTQLSDSISKPTESSECLATVFSKLKKCLSICACECKEIEDSYNAQLRESILKWLQELPIYANISAEDAKIREESINKLIDTVKDLQNDNAFLEKLEDEIKNCLKVLPMWRPENKDERESFENQLAISLIQKIKYMLKIIEKNKFKDEISKLFDVIPLSRTDIDKEKIVTEIMDKLEPMALNQPFSNENGTTALKSEITSILNDLPINFTGSRTTAINNIADMLLEKICSLLLKQYQSRQQENIKKLVFDWVNENPQIFNNINTDKEDYSLINDLITILSNMQNKHLDNKQKEINDKITSWLKSVEEQKKYRLDSNTRNWLIRQLINKIIDLQEGQNPREILNDTVQKWFDDISDTLDGNIVDNQTDLKNLVKKLQDLQAMENKENELNTMRQEILTWLQNLQRNQNRYVDSESQENLVNKLINMIKGKSNHQNISENDFIIQNIWKWLESQPEFKKDNSDQYRDIVMGLLDKLQDIKDKEGELNEYDLKAEITKWFEKLAKEHGIQIKPHNQKKLQDRLLSSISSIKRRKIWKKPNIQEIISKEVYDVIDESVIALEENAIKNLKDQLIQAITQDWNSKRSMENMATISKLMNILNQVTNLPETEISSLVHTLIERLKEALHGVGDTIQNTSFIIDNKANIPKSEAQDITNKILDMPSQITNEVKHTTYESLSSASADSLPGQKQIFMQRLEKEITDFMETILNESRSLKDTTLEPLEKSINRHNKLKNPPFKTSTPMRSDSGQDMNSEIQFINEMKDIIRKWLNHLEIDDTIDESFKSDMIDDIATDVIDRQRYLQLSNMKRSSNDEMDHLKYQLFKWTSKLPTEIDLTKKMEELKMLIKSLNRLRIPNLIDETIKNQDVLIENIHSAIWNWLKETPHLKPKTAEDKHIMQRHVTDLSKKLSNILSLQPNIQASNVKNECKDEIMNCFRKINSNLVNTALLDRSASDLIDYLKSFIDVLKQNEEISRKRASSLQKKDSIKNALQGWYEDLVGIKRSKTYDDIKDIVDNLAEDMSQYLVNMPMRSRNISMDDILNNLKKLLLEFHKEDSKNLPKVTKKLIETLKDVLNDSKKHNNDIEDRSRVRPPISSKALEVLYERIQNWCENLPLGLGNTNESVEQNNKAKHSLADKIMEKLRELSFDSEIFNDDDIYKNILKDEIQKILEDLPNIKQHKETLPTLKESLFKVLQEAKEPMKNEIIRYCYKQKLSEEISKTLSSIGLPISEETSLEVLKDNLADAFISLNYIIDDEELKKKFKDKVFNAVNKFCDDYLNQNPSTPLNTQQLNEEIYKAIKKVSVPNEESIRREMEHVRVKNIVTNWFKDLPLKEITPHIQENKRLSLLAKRLHEIQDDAKSNMDMDVDEIMNNEISKWLEKFKLQFENELSNEASKRNLINKLKAMKSVRKLNETTIRKSVDNTNLPRVYCPPSNLSKDDRAHLQRIKDRSCNVSSLEPTILKLDNRKDASVSPAPITIGTQTEELLDNYKFQKKSLNGSNQTIHDLEPPTSHTPQVIVKEYFWNSNGSPSMQSSYSILSYIQSPGEQLPSTKQQKAKNNTNITTSKETPQTTTASQTVPLLASKYTMTQETSYERVNLINEIKTMDNGRKLNETSIRKAVDNTNLPRVYYPSSNLSTDDRAHLQRTKNRSSNINSPERTVVKPDDRKDASVNPALITISTQTEELLDNYIFKEKSQNGSNQTIHDLEPPTSHTPQVIVKEYNWNSRGSPSMKRSYSILSYIQSPGAQLPATMQQKAKYNTNINTFKETPHATTATQTMSLPASKCTMTQETSYGQLNKTRIPNEESTSRGMEQMRIKDIVTDCTKDVSLKDIAPHIPKNKIISLLAKRLHEIENEAKSNMDMDIDEIMNDEISKWLEKFKLQFENELKNKASKRNLINKLKAMENSRKLNESTIRKSVDNTNLSRVYCPPSNLSTDDRAHLQRIKDRISNVSSPERTVLKPDYWKETSVNPARITISTQTEELDNYIFKEKSLKGSNQTIRDLEPPTSHTPQVIVKEYNWKSHGSPSMKRSYSILSYIQSPGAQLPATMQQKAKNNTSINTPKETTHVTTATQTMSLPASKCSMTQETSNVRVNKTQIQNDSIKTSNQNLITATARLSNETNEKAHTSHHTLDNYSNEVNGEAHTSHHTPDNYSNETNVEARTSPYNRDDYLQSNLRKKVEIKSYQPCRGCVFTGQRNGSPEAGAGKTFRQTCPAQQTYIDDRIANRRIPSEDIHTADKSHLDDQGKINGVCFRRLLCQIPTKGIECPTKRKRNEPCKCKNTMLTKCTIRPQPLCQHSNYSNKSCYISKKTCPKCWDGFCPYPSYLYFKQD